MAQRTIYPLFSTPVYVNNVGDFERPDLASLEFSNRTPAGGYFNFLSSTDKNILDRPDFEGVRDIVAKEVDIYARDLLAVSHNIEFYITNSWINIHTPGAAAGAHMHHNSLISGVLYLEATETSGDLIFHRDVLSLIPFPPAFDLDVESFNIYNCKSWGHRPKKNDVCLFPSVVSHSVEPNRSNEPRWSLAFNVFARGDFGALHKLSIK